LAPKRVRNPFQKYFYLICFTGYLREQAKAAINAVSEEEKKAFALTGGKCNSSQDSFQKHFLIFFRNHYKLCTLVGSFIPY
jgi:hypothetical protein